MTIEIIGSPQLDTEFDGVRFRLWINGEKYSFVVSEEALADLIQTRDKFDLTKTYIENQEHIHQVAEKLVRAGIHGDPILITTAILN
jgi:hypothetical protein